MSKSRRKSRGGIGGTKFERKEARGVGGGKQMKENLRDKVGKMELGMWRRGEELRLNKIQGT